MSRLPRRVRAAVKRLDADALADALLGLAERERRDLAPALQETARTLVAGAHRDGNRRREAHTGQVAALGTGTATELRWSLYPLGAYGVHPRLVDVVAARPANVRRSLCRALLDGYPAAFWPAVRDLARAGHIEQPAGDAYYLGLFLSLPFVHYEERDGTDTEIAVARLVADPQTGEELWRGLEREVVVHRLTSDFWVDTLVAAVTAGALDRGRLLDVSLHGQLRDLRPSASAFFRKVADALAPTDDELRPRAPQLLRVVGGSHPSEQRAAADRLRTLVEGGLALDRGAVAAAVATPLTGRHKAAGVAALRLLAAVDMDSETAGRAAVTGLGHAHEDVQRGALDVLERLARGAGGLPLAVREDALVWLDAVAPAHRSRLEALTGVSEPASDVPIADADGLAARAAAVPAATADVLGLEAAVAAVRRGELPPPTTFAAAASPPGDPVRPVDGPEELVEVLTMLLAGNHDPVELERAIDGLARVPARSASATTLGPLRRLLDGRREWGAPSQYQLAAAAHAWADRRTPDPPAYLRPARGRLRTPGLLHDLVERPSPAAPSWMTAFDALERPSGLLGLLDARLWEAVWLGVHEPRPTLALPVDDRGWLDAATLVARLAAFPPRRAPGRFEAVQALLRVHPEPTTEAPVSVPGRPAVAAALADLLTGSRTVEDVGLQRTAWAAPRGPSRLVAADVRDTVARSHLVRVIRFQMDTPEPRRRDDPVGELVHDVLVPDAANPGHWWNPMASTLPRADRLVVTWAAMALPRDRDAVAAKAATLLAEDMDENRAADALDAVVGCLVGPDEPLGWAEHTLLAVALAARNEAVGAAATDVLAAAAEDGRLDPDSVGQALAWLGTVGLGKAARFAARCEAVTDRSLVTAEQVRRVLQAWVAALDALPRDAHAALAALERACDRAARGIDDAAARHALEGAATGSSKRARTARRLLDLPQGRPDRAAADLLASLVTRAEAWARPE